MITATAFRKLALSFEGVIEQPHFEKASFRINKKIFATFSEANSTVVIKLSEKEQSVFCAFDSDIIYPVANKWGKQGWTMINLKKVKTAMLQDALEVAYNEVAAKK